VNNVLDDASKQRVKELCDLIAKEQDQSRFSVLIHELNRLLDGLDTGGATDGRVTDGRAGLASSNEKLS
jgi:hypothetical protein